MRCDNTGPNPSFTCQDDQILGEYLENDLKDTHVEWWRAYTDHLVHGLTASGGSLATLHSDRETTEELITALVGQIQGSDSLNLLTGLQVTTTITRPVSLSLTPWSSHSHSMSSDVSVLGGSGSHHGVPGPVCEETDQQL